MSERRDDLIYDWNRREGDPSNPAGRYMLDDETLRDGLQSPSVVDPPIAAKNTFLWGHITPFGMPVVPPV